MKLRVSFLAVCFVALVVMSSPAWALPIFCDAKLVVTCAFRTGDFTDSTDIYDSTGFLAGTVPANPHSATYGTWVGGVDLGESDTISQQTLPTLPGTIYDADFWSARDDADNQAPVPPLGDDPLSSSGGDISAWHILEGVSGTPIPEPGSMAMLGAGLLALAGVIRRKLGKQ